MSNEARKLPTRRGGWWRQGTYCPYIEGVEGVDGDLYVSMTGIPVVDDGTWLAPIPGPEVLAALAEYDRLDALIEGSDEVHADQPDVLRVMLRRSEALSALALAIRAERDGAA